MSHLVRMFRWVRALLGGQPIKTTWVSGGRQREVVTYKNAGETASQWSHRHINTLVLALTAHPPDSDHNTLWTSGGSLHGCTTSSLNTLANALATYPPDT